MRACQFTLYYDVTWRLADLLGYTDTWSAARTTEKALGCTPVETSHPEMTEAWSDPETLKRVRWPLSFRISRIKQR